MNQCFEAQPEIKIIENMISALRIESLHQWMYLRYNMSYSLSIHSIDCNHLRYTSFLCTDFEFWVGDNDKCPYENSHDSLVDLYFHYEL